MIVSDVSRLRRTPKYPITEFPIIPDKEGCFWSHGDVDHILYGRLKSGLIFYADDFEFITGLSYDCPHGKEVWDDI